MRLLQALRNQSSKINADLANSRLFTHMGDRGSFRESIIKEFLRPFLPECYGLSSGEIFSCNGEQSAQVDIIAYDAIFSTILFRNGPPQLFPAESVFGSIEVKSNLSLHEFGLACGNIASVKRLDRRNADSMDFLPTVRLELGAGLTYGPNKRNHYLGMVFGYDGALTDAIVKELSERLMQEPEHKQLLPDFIFVVQPGYMIARYVELKGKNCVTAPGDDYTKFLWMPTGTDTLPLFFLTLNACLGQLRLRSIDFVQLWNQLFFEVANRPQS